MSEPPQSSPLPVSTPVNSFLSLRYWPNMKPISRPPTPMSPAGTSVSGPMWRKSSLMKAWQKRMTSLSLLPFGSKSQPPLPPPMGRVVRAVLEHLLEGQELEDAEVDGGVEAQPALVRADGAVHLNPVAPVDLHLAGVVHPGDPEHDDPLRARRSARGSWPCDIPG